MNKPWSVPARNSLTYVTESEITSMSANGTSTGGGVPEPCCICSDEAGKRGRYVYPHGVMCSSCSGAFWIWKRERNKGWSPA